MPRWNRTQALSIATSSHLAHRVGVNGVFTSLIRTARASRGAARLQLWWSERRTAAEWGDLVRPDGYGVWAEAGRQVEFYLEYDTGSEPLHRLASKLPGYTDLALALGAPPLVCLVLHSSRRETSVRRALGRSPVPIATAILPPGGGAADRIWLPLDVDQPRRRLADLTTGRSAECGGA